MKMRSAKSSVRGYSIVEIAIVLVVIGLAFGGAVYPVYNRIEVENEESVREAMRHIKQAMLDYAARQRTVSRWVQDGPGGRSTVYNLPADRPYLPCPDIDGDGVEDRSELPPIDLRFPLEFDRLVGRDEDGGCRSYKGMMPWRTLNIPQYSVDWWGRRYTYRVDPAYANSLIGFNQDTVADKYDLRRNLRNLIPRPLYQERSDDELPGVVCGANLDPGGNIGFPCVPGETNVLVIAGDVATADVTLSSRPFQPYDEDDIISGVPAVIVSHGANGYGGVLGEAVDPDDIICVPFPDGSPVEPRFNAERQNAFREDAVTSGDNNCPRVGLSSTVSGGSESGFYALPHSDSGWSSGGGDLIFDDIIVWISADELAGEMSRLGVFPAAEFPRIGLE